MVQPITSRLIPADLYTSSHCIFGQIKVTNTGVIGLLSDINTSFIEVTEASVARVQAPDKVINYASIAWAAKSRVVAVGITRRDHAGAASLLRGGYIHVYPYPVQIATPDFEIQGTIEWAGRFDFAALMGEGTNTFFVLHDAVLTSTVYPALRAECPALCLNRNFLDSLILVKKTSPEG